MYQSPEDLYLHWRSRPEMLPDETHSLSRALLQPGIGLEGVYLLSDPGVPEPAGHGPQPPCQLPGLGRGRKLLEISQSLGDEILLGLVKLYEGAGILLQLELVRSLMNPKKVCAAGGMYASAGRKIYLVTIFTILFMLATKRIPVSPNVWAELSTLKRPGETFDQLLNEMIEHEKKNRLIEHLKKIADEGEFVEMQL